MKFISNNLSWKSPQVNVKWLERNTNNCDKQLLITIMFWLKSYTYIYMNI